ncbi:MAG: tRNA (adenosine(37)-N6)-threonylcarbamoyltransferase complex dimerization subunit type 1 TsaB, partial [Chloroflexota bacterium]
MLLAIDTSTAHIGLALYDGAQVTGEMTWISNQRHTVELAPALAGLLARTGLSMNLIQALGAALGPGSFTSLRVGLAFAKGLALARHLPLIGVPTLDVVAAGQPVREMPLIAVIQAGRGRIAVRRYKASENGWQAAGPARTTTADELAESVHRPTLVVGELSADERQRLARKRKNI